MDTLSPLRLWMMRAVFLMLAMTLLFFHLLPIETQTVALFQVDLLPPLASIDPAEARLRSLLNQGNARYMVAPDLLIAFAFAWSVRRPEYVPAILLCAVFLLSDLLLQRPPGLWALLALIACENLKVRGRSLRDSSFGPEWFAVTIWLVAILLANRLVLVLVLVPRPDLKLSLIELGLTVFIYPVVVLITHLLMGVRKATPGDFDSVGSRT